MVMILTLHANEPLGPFATAQSASRPLMSFIRLCIANINIVSVNVFIMISGWFGIKARTKGILSIFFQLSFFSVLLLLAYSIFYPVSFSIIKDTAISCLGLNYWFIPSYIILYVLSPSLNSFMEQADKKTFGWVLGAFLVFAFLYGRFGDKGHFIDGHSAIWFIGLYLTSGYLRRYPGSLFSLPILGDFGLFLSITGITTLIGFYLGGASLDSPHSIFHYNHPLVLAASVFFFLPFTKMKIQSEAINWLASSAFAIYVIHKHFMVYDSYQNLFVNLHETLPIGTFMAVSALIILLVAISCILLDKFRILAWNGCQRLLHSVFRTFPGLF